LVFSRERGFGCDRQSEVESVMDRAQKQDAIEALKGVFADAGAVVVTHYLGLTVRDMEDLRSKLREEGAALRVVKNRLAQKALNGHGEAAGALFTGPVAIAYAPDPVSAAKVVTAYAKDHEHFTVVGALMGADVLDAKAVSALASLPSLDQLRARILGMLTTPATRIAGVLQAPAAQIARVVGAYAAKDAA
jgi:large subunit ribosomal protein L10